MGDENISGGNLLKKISFYKTSQLTQKEFPIALRHIQPSVKQLFYKGNTDYLYLPLVAIVGSRKMSHYGREVLEWMVPLLIEWGFVIVSGLAYGVDAMAHKICLSKGGKAIAVMAHGLDMVYPAAHWSLASSILNHEGLLLSEYPEGKKAKNYHFPQRNRIIAGLCQATIVVEAQEKSGSLITAYQALDYNRDVLAVPGSIFSPFSAGTNKLIASGAMPVNSTLALKQQLGISTYEGAKEMSLFNSSQVKQDNSHQASLIEGKDQKDIYDLLQQPHSLGEISQKLKIEINNVSTELTLMELKGIILQDSELNWRRHQ